MPAKSHSSDFRYLKTTKSSYRTPWRHRLKRKQVQRSAAEKRAMKEKRLARKVEYADALAAAQDVVMQEAIKLHAQFATNTVEYFYEAILQNARTKGKRRGRNQWNAYLRGELKKRNNELDPMEPRLKASDIAPELSREWKSMSKEEKEHLTKDYMDELEEYRANKSLAVHNVAINSFHDVRSTLDSISVQLSELAARTGAAIFLVAVRGDSDHLTRPFIYMSEEKLADHFVMLTRLTPHKFATRLEACVISGVTGLVSNYKESYLTLKKELTSLIFDKLNQAAQVSVPKMFYNNFDTQITAKHGVVVDNWPLKNFVSPSDIGSTTELRVLHNALKTGVTTFRKMTHDEWEQWDKERFQSALLQHDDIDEGRHGMIRYLLVSSLT
ncbi:hypothetical protein CY34DRAFT_100326 [Suillus luteus UH-Slu-Lm8-n1]|uniref:HMG box domain-containing protein n=1 Tax=Suillus luteus UH-Slu-Lm8-n1 TaxID=930992 RepID=A0A0C9ZUM8_9AGAM|nr:hypothetical protein CY34DRAFT_100326 [Suillus luteus UH-Slu-Lm8-n1]